MNSNERFRLVNRFTKHQQPDMHQQSITDLAAHLVNLSDRRGFTPVLTTDNSVSLKPAFYENLFRSLLHITNRSVRLEILEQPTSSLRWLQHWLVNRQLRHLQRSMPAEMQSQVVVERRLILSRPSGAMRPFVFGVARSAQHLPDWGTRVELTTTPTRISQIQLVLE